VASSDGPFPEAQAASGKLVRFAQALSTALRDIRWGRTLQLVQ
jgi:hypothetical protein